MPTYTRKVTSVEARQYEGANLVVMSDAQGEQVAKSGDFLVGTERGQITVWPQAKFLAEFELVAAPAGPAGPGATAVDPATTSTTETHE